jgi:metal-responsive CopG/Arc/MetJ family transcriptional regulator
MKIAISLPDPLFNAAEELAEQLHVSRSQLYAQALSEYLGQRHEAAVTQKLNAVYGQGAEGVESAAMNAQLQVLGREAW